jgi:hypothetical protein
MDTKTLKFSAFFGAAFGVYHLLRWWMASESEIWRLVAGAGSLIAALGLLLRHRAGETVESTVSSGWSGRGPGHWLSTVGIAMLVVAAVLVWVG